MTHGPDPATIDRGDSRTPRRALRSTALPRTFRSDAVRAIWASLPAQWCGEQLTSDLRSGEYDTGGPRYHAIYAIPADGRDRFRDYANQIQYDAFAASGLLEALYGRSIRWDMGTTCGNRWLDISTVRLPQTSAELQLAALQPGGTVAAVLQGLRARGFDALRDGQDSVEQLLARDRSFAVWLDGPAPPASCGQASLYSDTERSDRNLSQSGGQVAIVYRGLAGSFCRASTVRHEIGHNLGAVQRSAPRSTADFHCSDALEDTMCLSSAVSVLDGSQGEAFFDYGNDDYWDPPGGTPLPWWTTNLSRFLCPDFTCNVPPEHRRSEAPPLPVAPAPPARISRSRATRRGVTWRFVVRVGGEGRARAALSCPRPRSVRSRGLHAPAQVRLSIRCAHRPRLRLEA